MSESCDTIEVVSHMSVSRPAASVAAPPAVAEKLTDASKPQGRSTTAAGTSSAWLWMAVAPITPRTGSCTPETLEANRIRFPTIEPASMPPICRQYTNPLSSMLLTISPISSA